MNALPAVLVAAAQHAGRLQIKTVMPEPDVWRRAVVLRWRDSRGQHEEILMFLEN